MWRSWVRPPPRSSTASPEATRVGIVRDGKVVAVLIDHDDAKIFESLELRAEEGWLTRVKEQEADDDKRYTADREPIPR